MWLINVGYNYPTPLANNIPKEITEQWKMDDKEKYGELGTY